jgi:transcriptional regulator of arginine metabolism
MAVATSRARRPDAAPASGTRGRRPAGPGGRREATRAERERRIRDILGHHAVETQEELVEWLRQEGLAVTQATVSRDIKRLGLVKVPLSGGRSQYVAPERPSRADVLRRLGHAVTEYVLSVDAGEDLVVVHTLTGRANAVAAAIDEMQWADVVGTIAGDDTILIVPRRRTGRARVLAMLHRVMEGGAP